MLLDAYAEMVAAENYGWSFAETVAANMRELFFSGTDPRNKAKALEIAILAAHSQNRFAAMDVCREMISDDLGEELGFLVAGVLRKMEHTFIASTPQLNVKDFQVRKALKDLEARSS